MKADQDDSLDSHSSRVLGGYGLAEVEKECALAAILSSLLVTIGQ